MTISQILVPTQTQQWRQDESPFINPRLSEPCSAAGIGHPKLAKGLEGDVNID